MPLRTLAAVLDGAVPAACMPGVREPGTARILARPVTGRLILLHSRPDPRVIPPAWQFCP